MNNKEKISFEDALRDLEEIVDNLNNDELDLEKAISAYEKGMELKKYASKGLKRQNLEQKILKMKMKQIKKTKGKMFQNEKKK